MLLLVEQRPYRQIEVIAGCSHRSIVRARRVLDEQALTSAAQFHALTREDLDWLFADGRKSFTGEFVPINIEKTVVDRVGRKKPPLKVLWVKYLQSDTPAGVRYSGYDRFCELVAEYARVNDLTALITHVPGHTMQVDWAGSRMQIIDPISKAVTPVSVFFASLPCSGLVFSYGYLDEMQPAWHDAH